MKKTQLIGEYKQCDGWHAGRTFEKPAEARAWCEAVDEAGGHHHARRWRRVDAASWRAEAARQAQKQADWLEAENKRAATAMEEYRRALQVNEVEEQ